MIKSLYYVIGFDIVSCSLWKMIKNMSSIALSVGLIQNVGTLMFLLGKL